MGALASPGPLLRADLSFREVGASSLRTVLPCGGLGSPLPPSVKVRFHIHLASFSLTSLARNAAILRISALGSGLSYGNWMVSFPVAYFSISVLNGSRAERVGMKLR